MDNGLIVSTMKNLHSQFPSAKIAIVGAGAVGSTVAYAATIKNIAAEILLIDINDQKEKGEVMDISDGMCFVGTGHVHGASLKDARDADIIVITAGKAQNKEKPESRLSLANANKSIIKSIFKQIGMIQSHAIVIIVSNPVDVLTYVAQEVCMLPQSQVFGTGTALDTARLRSNISGRLNVNAKDVHGFVLGEHGDSSFIAWSSVSVAGIPISKVKDFTPSKLKKTEQEVRSAAYEIISKKGATFYGIGLTIANILEAIVHDQKIVSPVSTRIDRWNGISNVCVGVPAVIGKKGIERIWPLVLNTKEKRALKKSANIIKKYID